MVKGNRYIIMVKDNGVIVLKGHLNQGMGKTGTLQSNFGYSLISGIPRIRGA